MTIIATATHKQRQETLKAYQYYRLVGHTPESAWRIARTIITRIIKA